MIRVVSFRIDLINLSYEGGRIYEKIRNPNRRDSWGVSFFYLPEGNRWNVNSSKQKLATPKINSILSWDMSLKIIH